MSIPHPPAIESAIDPVYILGAFSVVALGAALYAVWWLFLIDGAWNRFLRPQDVGVSKIAGCGR